MEIDDTYQIGRTAARRFGQRGLTISGVTLDGTTAVEDRDVAIDETNGIVTVLDTWTPRTYGVSPWDGRSYSRALGMEYDQVISGSKAVEGAMMFVEDNPQGNDNQWVLPKVNVRPNGDISLKGDEFRTIPFTVNVLSPSSGEAVYINGVPQ